MTMQRYMDGIRIQCTHVQLAIRFKFLRLTAARNRCRTMNFNIFACIIALNLSSAMNTSTLRLQIPVDRKRTVHFRCFGCEAAIDFSTSINSKI
ncbi:hypothetical protein D3C84_1170290 [compost metagenome]